MQTGVLLALVLCAMPLLSATILAIAGKRAAKWCDLVGIGSMGVSLAIAETSTREAVGAVVLMHRGHGLYGLGYWLVRAARGRGLASRAVALVAPWVDSLPIRGFLRNSASSESIGWTSSPLIFRSTSFGSASNASMTRNPSGAKPP